MPGIRIRIAALLLAAASPLAATTIVRTSDATLVDRATVIVDGTVDSQLENFSGRPVTDYLLVVDRVLKGNLGTSRIVVRLPGGRTPDGRALMIYGTPPLAAGVRTLLFLAPADDGTFRLVDFPQGAFVAARSRNRTLAFRDLSQVRELGSKRVGVRDPFRDLDRFSDWIEDRAGGFDRARDYEVNPRQSEIRALAPSFTFLADGNLNLRWFVFDLGVSVGWQLDTGGIPGLSNLGAAELTRALAVWTNEPSTPIRLTFDGTTSNTMGLKTYDGINVVLANDPNNEMEGKFQCSEGGTIATGGPWYEDSTSKVFDGRRFREIVGADIVFNDGIECMQSFSPNYSKLMEEVLAHEVGHTLGLDHSSENKNETNFTLFDALMFFQAHDDGRGARLASDDVAGLRTLYVVGGGSSGGGGGGGGTPSCPAGTLCLLNDRFHVTATWENQYDGSSGAAGPIPNSPLSGFLYFTDPSNVELIVKILDFGTQFKLFYSQLTNLRFTMKVVDTATGATRTYTNTDGECGAIDEDLLGAAAAAAASGPRALAAPLTVAGSCIPSPQRLCLGEGRFAVTTSWRNQFNGLSGTGAAKKLSELTGAFSFDDPSNLEILIKTLDFDGRVLVIYGSLSNLEYSIEVTDTTTGQKRTYENPAGKFCGGLDPDAF